MLICVFAVLDNLISKFVQIKSSDDVTPEPGSIDDKLNHPDISDAHRAALIKIKKAVTMEEKEKAAVT